MVNIACSVNQMAHKFLRIEIFTNNTTVFAMVGDITGLALISAFCYSEEKALRT